VLSLFGTAEAKPSDHHLPKRFQTSPYTIMSLSVGTPARGWQLRAKKLRPTPYLTIKQSSQHAVYGHPALVLMLRRTAKQMVNNVQSAPLVVGDLSSEHGGPLYGHRSHQSGRDADVGFFALDSQGKPTKLERFVAYDQNGRAKDGSGVHFDDYRNWLVVLTWMKDERADIKYVFVASHLRRRLLDFARSRPAFARYVDEAAQFLRQPSNASAHDDHFHVRIACPKRHEGLCKDYR
jgi:penicillin-insensitive murein endopeptidase